MADMFKKRLGDLLVDHGKISQQQLESVLKKQKKSGKRLGDILIEDNLVTEEDIIDVLEVQLRIERVYLDMINMDKQAVTSIPESLAAKYVLIPIGFRENRIKVAMTDPLNIFAIDDVTIASGYEVEPLISTRDEIKAAIDRYYSNQFAQKAAEELSKEQEQSTKEEKDNISDIKNAPAVRLVDSIIKEAVKSRASDIHIEPFEKFVKVRNRVDGELQETMRPPKEALGALVTRIKILANLNIAEKRVPQDGRILTEVDGALIDLRVSTLPTVYGEKVVIRVLRRDSFMKDRNELGINDDDYMKLQSIIKQPYGIVLVTGPTGSGKSTTLYSLLSALNTPGKNIITIEDPVEYMMDGVNQVNVNMKAGMTFSAGLKSILRQDPDIIMIGEIRDGETGEIAIRAAITGHKVLSTMHTNDAPSSVVRLIDMGTQPYLVSTSIAGVISQRLIKKICPYCKEEYTADSYDKSILDLDISKDFKLYRGKGCPYCNNSGYSGRKGVYEIMEITREHRKLILENRSTDDLRDLSIKNGMKTLRQACTSLVLEGVTTLDELVKIAYLKE